MVPMDRMWTEGCTVGGIENALSGTFCALNGKLFLNYVLFILFLKFFR